jgi:hypothetical protein
MKVYEGKRQSGRARRRWENNIKRDLKVTIRVLTILM